MENKMPLSSHISAALPPETHKNRLGNYIKSELAREPEKGKLTVPQIAKRGLVWFFAVMLALTFISRAANAALVAKVTVKTVSSGILDQSISGTGVWAAGDSAGQYAEFVGLRIAQIFVNAGDDVQAGSALYAFDTAAMEEMLRTLSDKIEQYRLQIKELKLGRGDTVESAQLALSQAERDLFIAQSKLDDGANEIAASKRQAYEDALYAYQTQATLRDNQISAAQQQVNAAQAALDPTDPETQAALDEAEAALSTLSAQWNYTLSEPLRALDKTQDEWNRVQNGTYNYSTELTSYRDAVTSAERALETARFNYEQAKDNDGDTNANVAYQIDSIELSMKVEQEKHDALTALCEQEGVVCSTLDGIVTSVNASVGSLSAEQAVVSISADDLVLKIQLSTEQANTLVVGDNVTLMKDGKATGDKLTLYQIGVSDANGVCDVLCTSESETEKVLGATQDYTIEKKSDKHSIRIPLSALREDGNGSYFVLIVGWQDTVLGTQDIAVRVDVQLIDHDIQYAAVDGGLSGSDKLIVGSNKTISAGDRVVIEDA